MQKSFLDFLEEQDLLKTGEKVLLAVSGGIDSMAMVDLFVWNIINHAVPE